MRLAAIYNVWDGEELLKGSIKQIYDHVDIVVIVWQRQSNFGEDNPNVKEVVNYLNETLANVCLIEYVYEPQKGGTENEKAKRWQGIEAARKLSCSHFIFMDCDEYYNSEQFAAAKQYVLDNDLDTSACKLYTYYKKPIYQLTPMEGYYVPFICKTSCHGIGGFPVYADPTRGVYPTGKFKEIPLTLCAMHHYSYIRKDIGRKLRNSSAKVNWAHKIPDYIRMFEYWQPGEPMVNFDKFSVVEVENQFNIDIG